MRQTRICGEQDWKEKGERKEKGMTIRYIMNWCHNQIKNKSKFLPLYLINGLICTDENISMSLNGFLKSHEIKNVNGMLVKPAPKTMKNYHH